MCLGVLKKNETGGGEISWLTFPSFAGAVQSLCFHLLLERVDTAEQMVECLWRYGSGELLFYKRLT